MAGHGHSSQKGIETATQRYSLSRSLKLQLKRDCLTAVLLRSFQRPLGKFF